MTKHQNDTHMLIGALRKTSYGPSFAKGCADNERLSDVLAKDASLRRVILDYEAARLEQISRSWKHNTAPRGVAVTLNCHPAKRNER
jgi:hypothetical protein